MRTLPVVIALSVVIATASRADEAAEDAAWLFDLPVAEAKKTDIGIGKYVGGATLLLLAPDWFGGYWPDFGYAWTTVVTMNDCEAIARDEVRSKADVGRVRVLAEKPGEPENLVGVEVQQPPMGVGATREEGDGKGRIGIGLTMGEVCGVIDNAALNKGLANVAWLRSKGVPLEGSWTKTMPKADASEKDFWPLWSGRVRDVAGSGMGEETWKLGEKKGIVWSAAEPGVWGKGGAVSGHALKLMLEGGSEALLVGKKEGIVDSPYWDPPDSFEINAGVIKEPNKLIQALEGVEEVEIWLKMAPGMHAEQISRMWLVTEYAIPSKQLEPDVRLAEFDGWDELLKAFKGGNLP